MSIDEDTPRNGQDVHATQAQVSSIGRRGIGGADEVYGRSEVRIASASFMTRVGEVAVYFRLYDDQWHRTTQSAAGTTTLRPISGTRAYVTRLTRSELEKRTASVVGAPIAELLDREVSPREQVSTPRKGAEKSAARRARSLTHARGPIEFMGNVPGGGDGEASYNVFAIEILVDGDQVRFTGKDLSEHVDRLGLEMGDVIDIQKSVVTLPAIGGGRARKKNVYEIQRIS